MKGRRKKKLKRRAKQAMRDNARCKMMLSGIVTAVGAAESWKRLLLRARGGERCVHGKNCPRCNY